MATKNEIQAQLTALQALVAQSPAGLGIEDIAAQSNLDIDRRTLQRRLPSRIKLVRNPIDPCEDRIRIERVSEFIVLRHGGNYTSRGD